MAIYTGADIHTDLSLECDVCIVGSGAGGAHVAARLAAAGSRVIVLEDGGFHTSPTFDMTEAGMLPRLYQQAGRLATADGAISVLQGRAVGGTTVVNWTTCYRTPPKAFDHWQEHHGVSGLTRAALEPHWDAIEERLNIHAMQPGQMNANNRVLWDGARKLGWDAHMLHRNVNRCAHTGYCGMGCPIDAKQSMLVTMLPDAVRDGADVYANTRVQKVQYEGGRATGVIGQVRDPQRDVPNGRTVKVKAKQVVLSGGAINTPAVLLRSGITANGRVGKRTFLHPVVAVVAEHKGRIEGFKGSPQYVASSQFADRGADKAGFLLEAAPVFPVLSAAASFEFGAQLHESMAGLDRSSVLIGLTHDGYDASDPDEGGTVTLNDQGRPVLSYAWSERLEEVLREANVRAAEASFAGGASAVRTGHARAVRIQSPEQLDQVRNASYRANDVVVFSAHVMGGCAMGGDPKTSVVDPTSMRCHGFDNLYVIDGSAYPTSLGVNPQLSIYGLASWASEHVKAAL